MIKILEFVCQKYLLSRQCNKGMIISFCLSFFVLFVFQAPVVQMLDSTIHWMHHYLACVQTITKL